jgi:hypothetical protein
MNLAYPLLTKLMGVAFTSDMGLGSTTATLVAALINGMPPATRKSAQYSDSSPFRKGASVPGAIFIGWATDRLDLRWPILLSTVGAAASVFLLWGFAQSGVQLAFFAVNPHSLCRLLLLKPR